VAAWVPIPGFQQPDLFLRAVKRVVWEQTIIPIQEKRLWSEKSPALNAIVPFLLLMSHKMAEKSLKMPDKNTCQIIGLKGSGLSGTA
jgi:hypothetical protein